MQQEHRAFLAIKTPALPFDLVKRGRELVGVPSENFIHWPEGDDEVG